MITLVNIAQEIYSELGSPSDTTLPVITNWLRNNIGALNNAISTCFTINATTLEIVETMYEEEKVIFKQMYLPRYYQKLIDSNMGAAGFSALLEVSSDGATVRTVNRNEVAKTYLAMKKQATNDLISLINDYKLKKGSKPIQVAGDDTQTPFNTRGQPGYNIRTYGEY